MSAIVPEFRVVDSTDARTVYDVALSPCWTVDWMFGGAVAAALAKAAALTDSARELVPVSSDVRFLRPTPSGPALISVVGLSRGARYSTARVALHVGGALTVVAVITLALAERIARDLSAPADETLGDIAETPRASGGGGGVAERVEWSAPHWESRAAGDTSPLSASIGFRDALFTDDRDETAYRYLVASDLLAPPLVSADRPLSVATVALHVSTVALGDSPWLTQNLQATEHDGEAVGHLTLSSLDGRLLAHSVQRAVVTPTTAEQLPFSATGFGWGHAPNSSLT